MRRATVAIVMALAVIALAAAPRTTAAIEKPAYARGDFWTYRTTVAEILGDFNGTTTIKAGDLIEVPVQGANVTALELSVDGAGTFSGSFGGATVAGTWIATGAEHWDVGSWQSVRSFLRLTARGTFEGGPQPLSFTFQLANETTRRVTEDTFPWPIADGAAGETRAHWNVSMNLTLELEGSAPQSNVTWIDGDFATTHVQNGTARRAAAGTEFDTYRIDEALAEGGRRVRYYAPAAGADVIQEEYNETDDRVAYSELTAYRYQATEPPPPFPWLYAIIGVLAAAAVVQLAVLAIRRRRPADVGTREAKPPPEKPSP